MPSPTQKSHNGLEQPRPGIVNRYCAGIPSSLFVVEETRAKRKRGAARTRRGRERQNQKNNKRMRKRGIEAGTSPLSVPNEEKRAGIIIKKPH